MNSISDSSEYQLDEFKSSAPLISIITVVRNAETVIESCLLSIIEQLEEDTELIIIDGCSTDRTVELIKKYQRHIKYWISEPDKGVYDAMNKGTKVARGRWIYFLGSDDVLLDGFRHIKSLLVNDKTIYYGNVFWVNSKIVYDGRFSAFKFMLRNISHQAILYPNVVFKKYNFNLNFWPLADYHLNMLCWGDKSLKFKYVNILLAQYNDEGLSARTSDQAFIAQKSNLIRMNFNLLLYLYYVVRHFLVDTVKSILRIKKT